MVSDRQVPSVSRCTGVSVFALFMMVLALSTAVAADHAGAKQTKASVEVTIKTKNQAALLNTKKLNLNVRATAPTTMRVKVRFGGSTQNFASRRVRFNKARTKMFSLSLTKVGRETLSTCGAKTVKAIARYSMYRRGDRNRKSTRKKTLAESSKQCPPPIGPPIPIGPPTAKNDNPLTDEESARYVEVLANDLDPSGTTLTIVSVDDSGASGSASIVGDRVRYDPDGGFEALAVGQTGSDAFTYTIEDGRGERDTATVNVEIEGVDDPSKVTATPELYPEYSTEISDYVTRCNDSPVQFDVEAGPGNTIDVDEQGATGGDFSTEVDLAVNQGFTFTRSAGATQQTHYVRCLPADFLEWTFTKFAEVQQQWYLVSLAPYNIMFDGNGVPVWWFRDSAGPNDFKYLADGTLAWTTSRPRADPRYEVRALDGTLLNTLRTVGTELDGHDLQLLPNGNYMVMSYKPRANPTDLTPYGGPADATVQDAEIQEIEPDGTLVWSWNSGGHIGLDATGHWWDDYVHYLATLTGSYDVVHINSVDVTDDSLVISMRHNDAIYKIDRATGDIVWKLGGTTTPKSLSVIGDSFANPLGGQHDARILPDGTLTAHDNGYEQGRPPRAVRFGIDEGAGTATLLESVNDPDVPEALCCGSARRSDAGSWVMAWGGAGATEHPVSEFTADGTRTFKLTFNEPGKFTYRAIPVAKGELSPVDLRNGMDARFPRLAP